MNYAYIKHDHECTGVHGDLDFLDGGQSRPELLGYNEKWKGRGLPETIRALNDDKAIKLTSNLQWAWFNQFKARAPLAWQLEYLVKKENSLLVKKWVNLTADDRAFTNKAGSTTRANYPAKTNLDKEDMVQGALVCGGWCGVLATGLTSYNGEPAYGIKMVNVNKPLPKLNRADGTLFLATISRWVELPGNRRVVEPFPQLNWNNVPVIPFFNDDVAFFPAWRIRLVDKMQYPYVLK